MTIKAILGELRAWRGAPSRRELLRDRYSPGENLSPVPLELPVGYETPPTMTELIQMYVRQEVSQAASDAGQGTFDQEDDFSEDDSESLPMENFTVNEYSMEDDPEMPTTAPVDDPPPTVPEGDADPLPNEGKEPPEKDTVPT